MGKRRRERDRPKSGPDAQYDPNKRVLLSYASDDEGDVEDPTEQPPLDDSHLANYQIDEYPNEEQDAESGAQEPGRQGAEVLNGGVANTNHNGSEHFSTTYTAQNKKASAEQVGPQALQNQNKELAAVKTKLTSKVEQSIGEDEQRGVQDGPGANNDETHHQRPSNGEWKANSRRDYSTGQFYSLGTAFDEDDGENEEAEGYDSTTEEAMAYLESVKNERYGIPEILAITRPAQNSANRTDEVQDVQTHHDVDAFYSDEAFIGARTSDPGPINDPSDPQVAFTLSLKKRFLSHRDTLRLPPTIDALSALSSAYPISFPQGNNKAYVEWHRLLSTKPPKLAQLQALEQDTIFTILSLLQKHFLVKGKNVKKNTSAWIWSLLARLEEVGNMTNDEVYPLRELGKAAVLVQLSLTDPEAADALQQAQDQQADESILEEAAPRDRSMPQLFITENTKATLDMILVVVGDVFRQRDLLEFRQTWTAESGLG